MARSYHLLLVAPHRFYRRPPDLDVPELRAAFDRGAVDRSGALSDEGRAWLADAGNEQRRAYWLARRGPAAPPRLVYALIPVLAGEGVELALASRRESERIAFRVAAFAAVTAILARIWPRRPAPAGELTHETAPIPMSDPALFVQVGIMLVVGIVRRSRTSERTSIDRGTALAVRVVRELMRQRSWNAVRRELAART